MKLSNTNAFRSTMRPKSFTKFSMPSLMFMMQVLFMVILNLKIFLLIKKRIIFLRSSISAHLRDTRGARDSF